MRSHLLLSVAALSFAATAGAVTAEPDGSAIYQQRCATCHEQEGIERMPTRTDLRDFAPESIVAAMKNGLMQPQAAGLSDEEMHAVAGFLSTRKFGAALAGQAKPNTCTHTPAAFSLVGAQWNGWGVDLHNTRFQSDPGLTAADVAKLKPKWAYSYPGKSAYGQPTLVAGRAFVTSSTGQVSALDANTGCAHWVYDAGTGVKAAVSAGPAPAGSKAKFAIYLGDEKATVHAIDADTGELIWKKRLDEHESARITGAPKLHGTTLYVPISSLEEGVAANAKYECCTFRGSIAAVDTTNGKVLWKNHTIKEEPKPFKKSSEGTQMFGPAGAAVWNSPTIDAKRGLLYFGTGNSYTDVETDGNNAIMAFDMKTGERKWFNQVTPKDNFITGCFGKSAGKKNCPEEIGPDVDFGASVILKTLPNGKDILIAGQKSGTVYGLDPDNNGKIIWETSVGAGGPLGGIEWGMAADDENVYVANSDVIAIGGKANPGLTALKLATGEKVWHVPTPAPTCGWKGGRCGRAQSAAVTAIPGVVFSGTFDGWMRAYSTKDGSVLWSFDTGQTFDTVNGVKASGANIDGGGPTIANGRVFVNSGYGSWVGGMGKLMLVFTVDGK